MADRANLLDVLVDALQRAGMYNQNDQVAPVAVLWPDREKQWEPLLPELRKRLGSQFLTLGPYLPEQHSGPAYYLRCMIGRTLPEERLPADVAPILYLPGVSRQELRAIEECPKALQPLAELQYRGAFFSHKNGRDWTVAGFIQNAEQGLGIQVAGDTATREALGRALPVLAHEPLAALAKQAPLRALYLDALLNPDDVRRLLMWMDDPQGYPKQVSAPEWRAFCALCNEKYGLHPEKDGPVAAAQALGHPKGEWQTVWQRFSEAPDAYPALPDLLRRARPQLELALSEPSPYWPQDNETAERVLRQELLSLQSVSPSQARAALRELEGRHGVRRTWVWATLGLAPLASALEALIRLAAASETSLGGADVSTIAQAYTATGWRVDAAVIDALTQVEAYEDVAAVQAAILPLYQPWLEQAAVAFQQAIVGSPAQNYVPQGCEPPAPGTCLLFSDAFRFDASQRLVQALTRRGLAVESGWNLAALPPVTATAKPAVTPVAAQVAEGAPGLTPVVRASGAPLDSSNLRRLLREAGYQVLDEEETGDPTGLGWTEGGAIDAYGHEHGWKVARHLGAELRTLEGRVAQLLEAGWARVRVITDHGWLLLPGGLPKVELPEHLTLERKGRCAVLKEGAQTEQSTVPWHWDPDVSIAMAPGINCYEAGKEYEHGGLSAQECVVPILTITAGGADRQTVEIAQVTWRGLVCRVEIKGAAAGSTVDIRTKAADAGTSLVETPKAPNAEGLVSLPIPDDARQGEAAFVVLLAEDGSPRAQTLTTVGG